MLTLAIVIFLVECFTRAPWYLQDSLLGHMAQILALEFNCWVTKPCYRQKTLLVKGETRTRLIENSLTIAASFLSNSATPNLIIVTHYAFSCIRNEAFYSIFHCYSAWDYLLNTLLTQPIKNARYMTKKLTIVINLAWKTRLIILFYRDKIQTYSGANIEFPFVSNLIPSFL